MSFFERKSNLKTAFARVSYIFQELFSLIDFEQTTMFAHFRLYFITVFFIIYSLQCSSLLFLRMAFY